MPKDLEKELKELFTRFILNAPQQHKSTLFRVCYELEQAFWFYLDVCREKNPQLPHFKFVEFMELMFDRFSNETLPRPKELDISKIHKWYQSELRKVPTCGVIMLDCSLNNVLLVEAHKSGRWSFPKGKINEKEEHINCAVREVKEECGIDITPYLDPDKFFVDYRKRYIQSKLFFALNVPHCDFFAAYNMEVRSYKWWSIERLFDIYKVNHDYKFDLIYPFLNDIKKYSDNKKKVRNEKGRNILALLGKSITKETEHKNDQISRAKIINPNEFRPLNLQEDICANLPISLTDSSESKNEGKQSNDLKKQLNAEYIPIALKNFSLFDSLNFKKFIPKSLNLNTKFGKVIVHLNEE